MPVKIKIDPVKVGLRVMGVFNEKVLPALTSEVRADCNEYVKVDQHELEQSSYRHSELDKGRVIWETPYAKKQYWQIQTSLTPGRTWKWCETAKRKCKTKWKRSAERGLRDNL